MKIILAILAMLMAPLANGGLGIGTTGGIKNSVKKLDAKADEQKKAALALRTPLVPLVFTSVISNSQINLNWSDAGVNVGYVTSYSVYRNGNTTPVAALLGNAYNDVGLNPSTLYSYTVKACTNLGYCSQSAAVSATTLP